RKTRQLPEVDATLVSVGHGDQRQPNVASVYVHMTDPETRSRDQAAVMQQVRTEILPDVPEGTRVAAQQVNDFSIGGQVAIVSYVISGPDLDKLEKFGKQILAHMKDVPGVVDLDSSLLDPIDETAVK